jgi:hypothetical protein
MGKVWILLALWCGLASPGRAAYKAPPPATVAEADARAVRAVIEGQLEAFAADDAARAFSYASPAIRQQFGGADAFWALVRQGYPMVIRPSARSFFKPQAEGDSVWQIVLLRDGAGKEWRATYQVQRQKDKTWRINGCTISADDGRSST